MLLGRLDQRRAALALTMPAEWCNVTRCRACRAPGTPPPPASTPAGVSIDRTLTGPGRSPERAAAMMSRRRAGPAPSRRQGRRRPSFNLPCPGSVRPATHLDVSASQTRMLPSRHPHAITHLHCVTPGPGRRPPGRQALPWQWPLHTGRIHRVRVRVRRGPHSPGPGQRFAPQSIHNTSYWHLFFRQGLQAAVPL